LASSAMAQIRTGEFVRAARFGHIPRNHIVIAREHHALNPAYGYYGTPYFYSDYYEPSDFEYQPPEPSPPPIQVQIKTEPLPDPVLLELHGSRWVKVTNFGESSNRSLAVETPADTQTHCQSAAA